MNKQDEVQRVGKKTKRCHFSFLQWYLAIEAVTIEFTLAESLSQRIIAHEKSLQTHIVAEFLGERRDAFSLCCHLQNELITSQAVNSRNRC